MDQGVFLSFIIALFTAVPAFGLQEAGPVQCLVREGRISVIGVELTALYERKLFVTKDDLARYVFLTNANYDGDSSVAVYRAPGREGSLRADYWVTVTGVSTSLGACISAAREKRPSVDPHSLKVRRADAPIPASTAQIVHELWLTMLERSRINERAVPCAPTAIISATTARGLRLKAVTVSLGEDSQCLALMRLGQDLINYPQLSQPKRLKAAREIEKESRRLLKLVSKKRLEPTASFIPISEIEGAQGGNQIYNLSPGEQRRCEKRAAEGDIVAAKTLVEYHSMVTKDDKHYYHWMRVVSRLQRTQHRKPGPK